MYVRTCIDTPHSAQMEGETASRANDNDNDNDDDDGDDDDDDDGGRFGVRADAACRRSPASIEKMSFAHPRTADLSMHPESSRLTACGGAMRLRCRCAAVAFCIPPAESVCLPADRIRKGEKQVACRVTGIHTHLL